MGGGGCGGVDVKLISWSIVLVEQKLLESILIGGC